MSYSKTAALGVAALASQIATTTTTFAASIAVNFAGGAGGDGNQVDDVRTLAPTDVAGVIPATNWNNAAGASGSLSNLLSDQGATASAVSWQSNGQWTARNTPVGSTPNQILTNGYIDDLGDPGDTTITFTGLSFIGAYDVFLYYGSDGNDRTGSATIGTTVINFSTNTNPFDGTFTPATPAADGTGDDGEYALFSGVTGNTFTVTVVRGSNNVGVHGIQVVGIPEPTSIGLLSFGIMGLVAHRRRTV